MKRQLWLGLLLINLVALTPGRAEQNSFTYDSRGKRDPFVPVVTREGVRSDFRKPRRQEKLPLQISVSGILYNGKEYFAIINGKVVKAGGKVGTLLIKEISFDKVILNYGEKDFEISLKKEKKRDTQ
jgi:hypothetical protein